MSTSGDADPVTSDLYDETQLAAIPIEAKLASLGCGNPTALAELKPGEVVLDLGSGGGIDVLLSAKRVGPSGKAYGLDLTDDMLTLARENQQKAGLTNVDFLKGEIERIPLADNSVDAIISNCCDQPLGGQEPRRRRGLSRSQARRALRGVGRGYPRPMFRTRFAGRWSCGSGVSQARSKNAPTARSSCAQDSKESRSSRYGSTAPTMRDNFCPTPACQTNRRSHRSINGSCARSFARRNRSRPRRVVAARRVVRECVGSRIQSNGNPADRTKCRKSRSRVTSGVD